MMKLFKEKPFLENWRIKKNSRGKEGKSKTSLALELKVVTASV